MIFSTAILHELYTDCNLKQIKLNRLSMLGFCVGVLLIAKIFGVCYIKSIKRNNHLTLRWVDLIWR